MQKVISFSREVVIELKKVTWPSKDEAISSSIIVIGFIVIFSVFLSLIDWVVEFLILALVR